MTQKSDPFYSSEPYLSFPRGAPHEGYPLSTKAVAASLGMSEVWLANLRSKGRGPRYVQVGTRVYYSQRDVEQWRRAHDVESPAVRVHGPELAQGAAPIWYEPAADHAAEARYERIFKVDLPRELATVANGGVGYLVLAGEPDSPTGARAGAGLGANGDAEAA